MTIKPSRRCWTGIKLANRPVPLVEVRFYGAETFALTQLNRSLHFTCPQVCKPKRYTNAASQVQYKPVTIEKWDCPCSKAYMGLKAANTEPFPRGQKLDVCCQICWSPVSQEHPDTGENNDDMPQ